MKKIVINDCHGNFDLSNEGLTLYSELSGVNIDTVKKYRYEINDKFFSCYNIERDDPNLIKVVETLGKKASGKNSKLEIIEIPDDVDWLIDSYDGKEWVAEKHRKWFKKF
jgi:hypothetical protein